MVKLLIQFFLLNTLLIFISCTTYNSSSVKSIDSLIVVVDSLSFKISSFNTDTLNLEFENIKQMEKNLLSNIDSTSVDNSLKQTLIILGKIHKSYKKFIQNYSSLSNECTFSVKQLNDLRNDAKSNIVKNEELIGYFNQENEELNKLSISVNYYYRDMITAKRLYLQQINSVDSFVDSKIK